MQLLFLFFSFFLSLSLNDVPDARYPPNLKGKVIGIIDGDTIDILFENKPLRIRLAHIDCPELRKKQPYGEAAKKFASDHCFGQVVTIQHTNQVDRNKRLIGELITARGKNLNKELVKAGLAWHFVKYSSDREYAAIQQTARKSKIGLWKDQNPTPPWNWRKPVVQ